jgi:hypothetical protein
MFWGSKVRLVCGADKYRSRQCGILNISQPYRPMRLVTAIVLLFLFYSYILLILLSCLYSSLLHHGTVFFNPINYEKDSLHGGSALRKASAY